MFSARKATNYAHPPCIICKDCCNKDMNTILKSFSRYLRRDFLGTLVKTTAKELNVKTVRVDWRTRQGMLLYLSENWSRISKLLTGDTFFNWYCNNYSQFEELFSVKSFVLFIHSNWKKYSELLTSSDVLFFLKEQQSAVTYSLQRPDMCDFSQYSYGRVAPRFFMLLSDYCLSKGINISLPARAREEEKPLPTQTLPPQTCGAESIFHQSIDTKFGQISDTFFFLEDDIF